MLPLNALSSIDRRQTRLLNLAAIFLGLYAAILSLSPAARLHTWAVDFRWQHWLGMVVWMAGVNLAHRQLVRRLPNRDPYLLPVAALLSGWGMLTIWRLSPSFGLRQTAWLLIALLVFSLGLRLPSNLDFLPRYKYVWLTSGLLLTALTLLFGANPAGADLPQLWLGCCGFYFQPSEPLKLLLVVYLAAYLAGLSTPVSGQISLSKKDDATGISRVQTGGTIFLAQIGPTLIMTGLAVLLLLAQRDLGTAAIFLFLYAVVVYLASANKWIVLSAGAALALAGLLGYLLFDVVRLRVDAWLNPWLDPSGRSYQIVQSLIAIASGGLVGRGPGMGSPSLVPVARSDFIFAALAEESGLLGTLGLLSCMGLLAGRGLVIALRAPNRFTRYLAAGLAAHIVAQSVLIVGGNLRLLPLTGVTLPFVSYGGSSLLTSFLSLLALSHISAHEENRPAPLPTSRPYLELGGVLLAGIAAAALVNGWWAFVRAPDLLTRTDNARRAIADRYVRRGAILDRSNQPLVETLGEAGEYTRVIRYPDLSPVIGYNHPVYGQSGLEASLDPYLRGLKGYPGLTLWWHHLLYGQPPPGLDIRTTLDLSVQQIADAELGPRSGALVALNPVSGEILAMASHPTFDANQLGDQWAELVKAPGAPFFNRAILGRYSVVELQPRLFPEGFPNQVIENTTSPGLPPPPGTDIQTSTDRLSPLQVALLAAILSNQGVAQPPVLVNAVNIPQTGWVILPAETKPWQALTPEATNQRLEPLRVKNAVYWETLAPVSNSSPGAYIWYVGGTMPEWNGTPVALALLLEQPDPELAKQIGQAILQAAMGYPR